MITLAWRLSLVSHYLHHNLKNGLMDVNSSRSLGRERPESYALEDIVNHREWMDKLTEKVIDSIVENVICECEERDCLVEKYVGNMIDLFVDSKEGYREHSEEDDMIIEKVTNELIDGIVEVLCEPPPERQFVSEIEYTQPLQASITACELIILAMSRMIMVFILFCIYCRKANEWLKLILLIIINIFDSYKLSPILLLFCRLSSFLLPW